MRLNHKMAARLGVAGQYGVDTAAGWGPGYIAGSTAGAGALWGLIGAGVDYGFGNDSNAWMGAGIGAAVGAIPAAGFGIQYKAVAKAIQRGQKGWTGGAEDWAGMFDAGAKNGLYKGLWSK